MTKTRNLLVLLASVGMLLLACNQEPKPEMLAVTSPEELVKHGEYLVTIMGCHDCHSPKVMGPKGPELDAARLLSGHPADMPLGKIDSSSLNDWVLFNMMNTAAVGPWGISYAANLTPDDTGIGAWTEEQFKKAIKEGKSKGLDDTRPLLPPMPWQNYINISDEDAKAIFAYLKSVKPIANAVPNPQPLTALAQ